MNINNTLNELKKDVVIPEIVQEKADCAFSRIQEECRQGQSHNRKIPFFGRHKIRAAAAVILLIAGAVSVSAAAYHISQSLKGALPGINKHKTELNDFSDNSVLETSDEGITVKSIQRIADSQFAYLAFEVDGYELPKDGTLAFEDVSVTVDGSNGAWAFPEESFVDNEFAMNISSFEKAQKGESLIGKEVCVQFTNLGYTKKSTMDEADYNVQNVVKGSWEFCWILEGSDECVTYELSGALGNSGSTVVQAELSPISAKITYNKPYTEEKHTSHDSEGNTDTYMDYVNPPDFIGIQMKDGSICWSGTGSSGYSDTGSGIYVHSSAFSQVLDLSEIEALLFSDHRKNEDGSFYRAKPYVVPIRQ